ncbi:MAG: ATPase [Gemmatimonadetes bacterium]|nr:ATPase [Gemmatimonadota bacterium]
MITRQLLGALDTALSDFPVVGLLGPRQVGKTTLAHAVAARRGEEHVRYLDLESPADRARLSDAEAYLEAQQGHLVILDEIHRVPELFAVLRGLVDRRRRRGSRSGQFLVLGSASLDLLQQSSESLAGRITYLELTPVVASEVAADARSIARLWNRGGFPDSLLARSDDASLAWRRSFIRTYLERDIPQFGPRIPAETLRRFWTMLAHSQGQQMNSARIASSLGVSGQTVTRYLDLLTDLLLVRRLSPWSGNIGKRLVRAPKVYVRDSGLVHALLDLASVDDVLGHPVAGPSWEGMVIESLIAVAGALTSHFYRTSGGAEIDLVLEGARGKRYAVEIKRSTAPTPSKGFWNGCADIQVTEAIVAYPGDEVIPLGSNVQALGIHDAIRWVRERA